MLRQGGSAVNHDINVLALVKGAERSVFLSDNASRAETLRTLGRFASNPDLSFTWYDAAVLSQKIRQESQKFVAGLRDLKCLLRQATMGRVLLGNRSGARRAELNHTNK